MLQINIPAFRSPLFILEREGEDGVALLYGVFSLGIVGSEGAVDDIEGGGGGERVCDTPALLVEFLVRGGEEYGGGRT